LGLYKPPRRRTAAAAAHGATSTISQQQQQQQETVESIPSSSLTVQQHQQQQDAAVIDWGAAIRSTWDISERGALQLLSTFLTSATGLSAYESARSYADGRSVSKLSPYLHFGQLSARLMWQRMKVAK
jgi:deoxyribodipyrimidine photolyase